MSSKIKVDTIENVAGSGNVSLGSGHNLVVPGNATISGSFTVDTSTLKVDATNNRVGIGTASPSDTESLLDLGSGENTGFKRKLLITNTGNSRAGLGAESYKLNVFIADDQNIHFQKLTRDGNFTATQIAQIGNDGVIDAGAFTGTYGESFGILDSTSIGDSNIPYNSFGTPNSTYYRWVLPKAGTYLLSSNMRIRLWGVHGYIKSRLYNNTTSTAIEGGNITGGSLGSQGNIRMLFENAGGGTAETFNINITANYITTTVADNQDIHHQLNSNNNSTNSSLQSDANGRSIHYWQRIG